ncbi:hypothetical protein KM043_012011 [Ampulex compressa]|nr:hypothetical protein KM043_012011 [Ampulex compressa]
MASASRGSKIRGKKLGRDRNSYASSFSGEPVRSAPKKSKSRSSNGTLLKGSDRSCKQPRSSSNIPKDAAVHFGAFYGLLGENTSKGFCAGKKGEVINNGGGVTPRMEFTRQMVNRLERTAGTEDYARQVSALFEKTVEPPNFKLAPLPPENSIPDGRENPSGCPLWYRDPYRTRFGPEDLYEGISEGNRGDAERSEDSDEDISSGESIFQSSSEDECAEGNGSISGDTFQHQFDSIVNIK